MPWSPRQLADLAGVSVKAIRYYHQIGVLAEPARAGNGYRQYTVTHLLRLLQIRRLTGLRVPLSQIPPLDQDGARTTAVLRAARAEVGELVRHLQRVQDELDSLLHHGGPVDVPPGFEGVAESLTGADRSLLLVCARLLDDRSMAHLRALSERLPRTEAEDAFDTLDADASEAQIARTVDLLRARRPAVEPATATPSPTLRARDRHDRTARRLLGEAIAALYNPAQQEVLRRLQQRPGA